MKHKPQQSEYNQTINLTSHLILTQPKAVMALLANYEVFFKDKPSRSDLINQVVELMKESGQFSSDLGELLALHVQENGKEMMQLEGQSFTNLEEDEDAFLGGLIKGAVSLVGGLFKKKNRSSGDSGAAARAASAQASAQAASAKRDMAMQMARMREEQRRQEAHARRQREEARRREQEERNRREAQAKAEKGKMNMILIGGGVAALLVVCVFLTKSGANKTAPYYPRPMAPPIPPSMSMGS